MDEDDLCEEHHEDDDLDTACVSCGFKHYLPVRNEEEFDLRAGVFFTAEACDAHIAQNKHHYEGMKAVSYGISAWRNPEMQTVMQYLSENADPMRVSAPFYQ